MKISKADIRREMKIREADFLASHLCLGYAERIWERVEAMAEFQRASTVLAYMSIKGEVPTEDFLEKWYGRKKLVLPKVVGESLELREFNPMALELGYKGIMEPSAASSLVNCDEVDFAIVPGVAFCVEQGRVWRMGRGKGFYDRLLPNLNCPTCAVCYPFRVLDNIPRDEWDVPLDFLVD